MTWKKLFLNSQRKLLLFRIVALFLLSVGLIPAFSCAGSSKQAPYPHQSVLSIVTEMEIATRFDPYREEPKRDLEGQNIFRTTLRRLDALSPLLSEEYEDILNFARAECYERLGDWESAAHTFGQVVEAGTTLSEESAAREQWVRKIHEAREQPAEIKDLEAYVDHLESVHLKLGRLAELNPTYPYDSYILIEKEAAQRDKAAFLFANRMVIEGGAPRAVAAADRLIERTSTSRRHGEHKLLLGSFYETLGRDYARRFDPTGLGFDAERWTEWNDKARILYGEVAQADGDPAKPEAQARLRVLDAFSLRILQRAH